MKKILFITPFEPSQRTGGQNFTRLLLDDLSKSNKIDVVMFLNKKADYDLPNKNTTLLKIFYVSKLIKFVNVLMLPFCFPFFSSRFNVYYLLLIKKYIRCNDYDFMYIDYSQLFIYGLFFQNTKKILMSHDIIYQRYVRKSNRFISDVCSFCESFLLKRQMNSQIFTFSNKDSELLLDKYRIKSSVTSFYLDIPFDLKIDNLHERIVLFGSWKRPENIEGLLWFIENVQLKLNKNIEVLIIGSGLNESVINRISCINNMRYLGFVAEPFQLISESKALIAPIFHGAGVKVKVIESLALGTAVIGTEIAFEGVSLDYSEFMLHANKADDFIKIINNYKTTLEEKKLFKKFFASSYINHALAYYINYC